jgi:RNA polymerase sigma-70 factor (ECF subfamily)
MEQLPSDKELREKALSGDDHALRALFARHLKPLHSYLLRLLGSPEDADDVAQEALVRVWRNLRKYDPERSFRTWLLGIAHNAAVDFLRKNRPTAFSDFEDADGGNVLTDTLADPGDLPDAYAARQESAGEVRRALAELPEMYREVLSLRHDGELQFDEISRAVGAPLDTVKSRYRRGLQKLRGALAPFFKE